MLYRYEVDKATVFLQRQCFLLVLSGWPRVVGPRWVIDQNCRFSLFVAPHAAWLPQLHSIWPPRLLLARLDIIHLIITKPRTSEKRLRDGINETKLCLMFPIWFLWNIFTQQIFDRAIKAKLILGSITLHDVQLIRQGGEVPRPVPGCVNKAASGDPDRNIAWCHCAGSQSQPSSGSRDH